MGEPLTTSKIPLRNLSRRSYRADHDPDISRFFYYRKNVQVHGRCGATRQVYQPEEWLHAVGRVFRLEWTVPDGCASKDESRKYRLEYRRKMISNLCATYLYYDLRTSDGSRFSQRGSGSKRTFECPRYFCSEPRKGSLSSLHDHYLSRHMRRLLFHCLATGCNKVFVRRARSIAHMEDVHVERPAMEEFFVYPDIFPCPNCPRLFSNAPMRNLHVRVGHSPQLEGGPLVSRKTCVYLCRLCEYDTLLVNEYDEHVRLEHDGEGMEWAWRCQIREERIPRAFRDFAELSFP